MSLDELERLRDGSGRQHLQSTSSFLFLLKRRFGELYPCVKNSILLIGGPVL